MDESQTVRIDGLKWWVTTLSNRRIPVALCPDHHLRLSVVKKRIMGGNGRVREQFETEATILNCAEGPHNLDIPRPFGEEQQYVLDRIDAKVFQKWQTVNLDDEAVPIAKAKVKSSDDKYFVSSQLMESKRGLQLVVYAGEKGKTGKVQIIIEPEIKRLAFDQKDINPSDVFVELKATFEDGSSQTIKKGEK